MSWEITLDSTIVNGFLERIVDELDGVLYAYVKIPNTPDNRDLIASDCDITISFEDFSIDLKATGAKYGKEYLTVIAYDPVHYSMHGKTFSGSYTNTAANTILSDICTTAGVTAGSCPTDTISVEFDDTDCWIAAVFLAYCLNKDFWTSDGTTFNIGTKGSSLGELTPASIGSREIDRLRKYDKVIYKGYDKDGNAISVTVGSGTRTKVFFERKATDLVTLTNLATRKLAELSSENTASRIIFSIEDGYNISSGDTITLNDEERALNSSYRVYKVIKRIDRVEVNLDRVSKKSKDYLNDIFKNLEDLGIYLVSQHLEVPSGTNFPSSPSTGQLFYRTDLDACYRYNGSSWDKIATTSGEGTSFPANPSTGDIFYRTDENSLYRYDGSSWKVVHALSTHGTSFPASPRIGDFFYNTTDNYLYRYDGSSWKKVMHQASGSSFPASPEVGDTFYHTGYEQTFYYNGSNWVTLATIARAGTSFPTNAVDGDIFYRTDENKFYRYNGSSWNFIATPNLISMSGDLDDITDGSTKKAIEVVSSLPSAANYTGKYVYVTSGDNAGKTFYSDGSEWIPQEPTNSYRFRKHYRLSWESLDGYNVVYTGTSSATESVGRLQLSATDGSSNVVIDLGDDILNSDRHPTFKVRAKVVSGSYPELDLLCISLYGFYFADDGYIYASYPGGSQSLQAYSLDTWYTLEVIYDGSSIKYYIDGTLKHTETTNLPTANTSSTFRILAWGSDPTGTATYEVAYVDIFEEWTS